MALQQLSRGLTVQAPAIQAPAPVRPPIRRAAFAGPPRTMSQRMLQSAAANTARKQEEEDEGNPFGRGLGFLVNNPVTRVALAPLQALDYPRRAVTLGVEEALEAFTGEINPEDTRSNIEKLRDPSYGVGQVIPEVTFDDSFGNIFNRGVGLAGDIALDPLTYVAGIGFATKAGMPLTKAARAGMAQGLREAGIEAPKVARFVKRGASVLEPDDLAKLVGTPSELGRAGVRVGTRKHNIPLLGTQKIGRRTSQALGATGDILRNAPGGRTLAKIRTPERVEDAYQRLFHSTGPIAQFDTAATRVAMENKWRATQNTFRGIHDRSTRELRKASKRLDDSQRAAVLHGIETEAVDQITDPKAHEVAKSMVSAFDKMWAEATGPKIGLKLPYRKNYTPHILTRDAVQWLKTAGDDAAGDVRRGTGLITENLNDPSGVTMARKFMTGQELNVNGMPVKLDSAGILEVNEKFRQAGLDFDFFETDPSVIMQRYINMLSSDVGIASSIRSQIGKKTSSVRQLTPRQMEMLGFDVGEEALDQAPKSAMEALARGVEDAYRGTADDLRPESVVVRSQPIIDPATGLPTGQVERAGREINQSADLALAARQAGVELPEDVFQVGRAQKRNVMRTDKTGKPVMTKVGRAKHQSNRLAETEERFDDIQPFRREDFQWTKQKETPTEQYMKPQRQMLSRHHANAEQEFVDLTTNIEAKLESARSGATGAYLDVIKGHQARVRALTKQLNFGDWQGELRTLRTAELEQWTDQLDEFVARVDKDLSNLNRRVQRNTKAARDDAVRAEMDALRNESQQLRERLAEIHDTLDPMTERASHHKMRAEQLREKIYGPTEMVREVAEEARQTIGETTGLNRLLADQTELQTRIRDVQLGREAGDLDALAGDLRLVEQQIDALRGRRAVTERPPEQQVLIDRSVELRRTIETSQEKIRNVKQLEAELADAVEDAKEPLRKLGNGYVFRAGRGAEYPIVRTPEGKWLVVDPNFQPIETGLPSLEKAAKAADDHYRASRQAALAEENARIAGETGKPWTSRTRHMGDLKKSVGGRRDLARDRVKRLRAQLRTARPEATKAQRVLTKSQAELDDVMARLGPATPPPPHDVLAGPAALEERAMQQQAIREQMPARALEEPGAPYLPNVRSATDLRGIPKTGNISESGRIVPIVGTAEEISQAQLARTEALHRVERLEDRVAALRVTAEKDPKVSLRKRAITIARRKGGVGSGRHRRAEAMYQRELRDALERHGVHEAERELKRAQAIHNQLDTALRTKVVEDYSPAEMQKVREAIEKSRTLPAVEELQARRRAATGEPAQLEAEAKRLAPRVEDVQEQMATIVRDPEYREELRRLAGEETRAETLAAQEGQRASIEAIQGEFPGRRAEFTDELEEIARLEEERMAERAGIVRQRGTAKGQATRARKKAWQMNVAMQPSEGLPVPKVGDNEAWEASARARRAELEPVLRDNTIDPEVRGELERQTNDVLSMIDEAGGKDLETQQLNRMAKDARSGKLGRVIEVMLNEHMTSAAPHLIGDDIVMSKDLQRSYQRLREATYKREFWPVIDTFTNLFKTYATATPGFHVRNGMSAVFTNSADGVSLREQAAAARLYRKFRKQKDPVAWLEGLEGKEGEQIRQAFEAAFGSGIGGRYTEPGVGQRGTLKHRTLEKAFDNPYVRALGERPGANVEGIARLAPALQTIRNGGSVDEALMRVTSRHFDYSQMSRFDRNARRVIPFWTFMSRNMPLQISMMYMQPKRYAQYNSLVRNLRGEDVEGTPEYFGSLGAFPLGNTKLAGLPLFLQPDLPHTRLQEDLKRYEKALSLEDPLQALSDVNPLATTPLEFGFRKNLYTGREYAPTDVRTAGPLEFPIAALGSILGMAKETPGGERAYEERLFDAVRSLIPIYDRTMRLAPGAVTGGANQDAQSRMLESWARFLGIPIRQLSPQQQQSTRMSAYYDRLDENAMRRALLEAEQAS